MGAGGGLLMMMKMKKKVVVVVVMMMMMLLSSSSTTEAGITCGQVASSLENCLNYLKGKEPAGPSRPCCVGVRGLNSAARTTPDRQAACQCLKQAAVALGSQLNQGFAAGLPAKCGVSISYKISPSTNCKTVK